MQAQAPASRARCRPMAPSLYVASICGHPTLSQALESPCEQWTEFCPLGARGISPAAPHKYPKSQGQPLLAHNFLEAFCSMSHVPVRFAFSLTAQIWFYQWSG